MHGVSNGPPDDQISVKDTKIQLEISKNNYCTVAIRWTDQATPRTLSLHPVPNGSKQFSKDQKHGPLRNT